jgi:hypothetical protein|tara:strand:- start:182 stop:382 length:201 start_codon:yes stop_codon:yes gene_type:complete
MKKEITVQLTLEWTFNKREWSAEKKHIEDLQNDPKMVLGYDTIHSLFMLNEIDRPTLKSYKIKNSC